MKKLLFWQFNTDQLPYCSNNVFYLFRLTIVNSAAVIPLGKKHDLEPFSKEVNIPNKTPGFFL